MSMSNQHALILHDRLPGMQSYYVVALGVAILPPIMLKDYPLAGLIASLCVAVPMWFLARDLNAFTRFTLDESALQIEAPFRFNHQAPLAELTELYLIPGPEHIHPPKPITQEPLRQACPLPPPD